MIGRSARSCAMRNLGRGVLAVLILVVWNYHENSVRASSQCAELTQAGAVGVFPLLPWCPAEK